MLKFNSFNENLNQARAVLRRKKIDETNPDFVRIRKMLSRHLGYTGKFTKWHFEDGYSIARLEDLYKRIIGSNIDINKVQKPEDVIDLLVANTSQQTINQVIGSIPSVARQNLKDDGILDKVIDFVKGNLDKKDRFIRFFSKKGGTLDEHDEYEIIDILKDICEIEPDKLLKECRLNNLLFENDIWIIFAVLNYDQCKKFGSKYWCIVDDRYTFNDYTYDNDALQLICYNKTKEIFVDNQSVLGITVNLERYNRHNRKTEEKIYIEAAHWEDDSEGDPMAKELILNLNVSDIKNMLNSEEYVLNHPDRLKKVPIESLMDFYKKNKISASTLMEAMFCRKIEMESFNFILQDSNLIVEFLKTLKLAENGDLDDYGENDYSKYYKFIEKNISLDYIKNFPTNVVLELFLNDKLTKKQISNVKIGDDLEPIFNYIGSKKQIDKQLDAIDKISILIKNDYDFKESIIDMLIDISCSMFRDMKENYNSHNIEIIRKIASHVGMNREDCDEYSEFVIFGDLKNLSKADITKLYKHTDLNIMDTIKSFNYDLLSAAVSKDDTEVINKMLKLLPGNDKYNYNYTTKSKSK